MVIFLDVDRQVFVLYGEEGKMEVPFVKASHLFQFMGEKDALYVTNAVEANVYDLINMVQGMGVQLEEASPQALSDAKYIHNTGENTIFISDGLKFEGKYDIKVYDQAMANIVNTTPILQKLLESKQIEIIGELKRQKVMQEFKKVMDKQQALQEKADAQLDSMILNTKVSDFNGIVGDDIAEEMDITSSVNTRNFKTEEERMAEQLGIR